MTWWDERSVVGQPASDEAEEASSSEIESTPAPASAAAAAAAAVAAAAAAAAATLDGDDDPRPLATVDLEDPYLRDLVLEAFASRSESWRVERADGVRCEVTREEPAAARNDDDCNSSSSEEEERGQESFELLPHPALSSSRFHWGEYERIDWDRVASGQTMASSYAVRKGLTRKAQLCFGLKKWCSKRPASPLVGCFPETHVLQVDHVDYIDEALCDLPEVRDAPEGAARWIVKPSVANRAAGVAVVDGCIGLRRALEAAPRMREWVVQRYVDDPLLLPQRLMEKKEGDGGGGRAGEGGASEVPPARKWHVRSYALCVGALRVFSFGGMLALTAISGYEGAPLGDLDAHLTNTCRKREGGKGGGGKEGGGGREGGGGKEGGGGGGSDEDEDEDEGDDDDDDDRILLLSEIPALLSQGGTPRISLTEATRKTRRLAGRIHALVAETLAAVSSELSFFALPSAFELFGFDFLVDRNWNPWLLEANADPDVGASGSRLRGVIREMVEGVLRLTADELVGGEEREGEGKAAAPRSFSPSSPVAAAAGGGGGGGGIDGDDCEDDPLAPRWRVVFERDSGREGAGFSVA